MADKKHKGSKSADSGSFDEKLLEMEKNMIGSQIGFEASEAYKLLRANIMYTLPDNKCRVIGITSSNRGEGKSMTAINLAYSFAETEKRVLLIDADMRIPSVARRLELERDPGLSNVLANLANWQDVIRQSKLHANLKVLTAGRIPPNPNELLGSNKMEEVIGEMSEYFDFIIVDLPPVNVVSDAIVISKAINGLAMVVRQNHSSQQELNESVSKLVFLGIKILGFVLNDVDDREKGYRKYRYGHKYGKKYGKYGKYGKYEKYGYGYGGYGDAAYADAGHNNNADKAHDNDDAESN